MSYEHETLTICRDDFEVVPNLDSPHDYGIAARDAALAAGANAEEAIEAYHAAFVARCSPWTGGSVRLRLEPGVDPPGASLEESS